MKTDLPRNWILSLTAAWCGLLIPLTARQATGGPRQADGPTPIQVTKTFDGRTFSYREIGKSPGAGYTLYRLSYPSPVTTDLARNNRITAEYYLPANLEPGDAPRPAVICLHILNGNYELVRILGAALASRGVPALWFKLPYYGERGPVEGPRALLGATALFSDVLPQAVQDIRRTVDLLASRPEIAADRISVAGISLGGILAATATGFEPRLYRAGLILAGGDLLEIVEQARETREIRQALARFSPAERKRAEDLIRQMDPLTRPEALSARGRAGRVLMINAGKDEVVPRACTEALAERIGMADKVIWFEELGHYTAMAALGDIMEKTVAFFAQDLPPGAAVTSSRPPPATPFDVFAGILQQLSTILFMPPLPGRGHLADLGLSVTLRNGKSYRGELLFVRGTGGRFRLKCAIPEIGVGEFGLGRYAWLAGAEETVFEGTERPEQAPRPLAYADQENLTRIRVLGGIAAAAALGGAGAFENTVTVNGTTDEKGAPALELTNPKKPKEQVLIELREDGLTPRKATFSVGGLRGTIVFRRWLTNTVAHDELFEPPRELPKHAVRQDDVYRTFAGIFDLLMEKTE